MSKRNSNVELLRIISMLMIVAHHYIFYGVMQNYNSVIANVVYNDGLRINKLIAQIFLPGGIVGVGIFFVIMGYFGVQSDRVRLKSVVCETLFYSTAGLIVYICLRMIGVVELHDIKNAILCCINPLANSTYWFVSVYVIITLMKPVLNQFIQNMNHVSIFLLCFLIYYLLARYSSASFLGLINGCFFYVMGAFIRINNDNLQEKMRGRVCICMGAIGWGMYLLFTNSSALGVHKGGALFSLIGMCVGGTISVIGFTIFFLKRKKFVNKIINRIGAATFAVYLIHEHPLLRETLWSNMLSVERVQWNSKYFGLWAIVSILIIFVVSVLFEMVREKIARGVANSYCRKVRKGRE